MARKFQIKRGLKANLPKLAQGEFAMTTDSGDEGLHLGNGEKNLEVPILVNGSKLNMNNKAAAVSANNGRAVLNSYKTPGSTAAYRSLVVRNQSEIESLAHAFCVAANDGNGEGLYALYGEHNKPTADELGFDPADGFGWLANGTDLATMYGKNGWYMLAADLTYVNSPESGVWGILTVKDKTATLQIINGKMYYAGNLATNPVLWSEIYSTNNKPTAADVGAAPLEYAKKVGNPYNFLVNSNFRNPVNQNGQNSYKGAVEGIDKWDISSVAWMVSVEDGYIKVSDNPDSTSTATGMFRQYIGAKNLRGKSVTFVAKTKGKDVRLNINNAETGYYSTEESASDWVVRSITGVVPSDADTFFVALQSRNATTFQCEWVALYEGEYTAETLPAYQPKGYNVELLNCGGINADYVNAFINGGRIIDIDSLDEDGIHETSTDSTGTFPSGLNSATGVLFHKTWDANYKEQIFMSFSTRQMYHRTMSAGVWKEWKQFATTDYAIMKTDKPSGSYTGNGSATSRTIDAGGLGEVVLIYSANGVAIVTRRVGAGITVGGASQAIFAVSASYVNGTLTIASNDNLLNANGVTYYYQVL